MINKATTQKLFGPQTSDLQMTRNYSDFRILKQWTYNKNFCVEIPEMIFTFLSMAA